MSKTQPASTKAPQSDMFKFSKFFTYITTGERILLYIGTLSAIIAGALIPAIAIVMGDVTNTFDPDSTSANIFDTMKRIAVWITVVGGALWIFGYLYYAFWAHLSETISYDLRGRYLKQLLRQEIAFFEKQNVAQLPSQIGDHFACIQGSIGEKVSNIIFSLATCASGIGISFYMGPVFAAICLAYFPIVIIFVMIFGGKMKKSTIAKISEIKILGGLVEESLSAIKLVVSFVQEEREIKKFTDQAEKVKSVAQKSELFLSVFMNFIRGLIFGFYVYSFWIGTQFIYENRINKNGQPYSVGDILSSMVALITGMLLLMQLRPNIQALIKSRVVGKQIFDVIDRVPQIIDSRNSKDEYTLTEGIFFNNITFRYPTALEKTKNTLQKVSFQIKAGQTTAIVGPSGSGKSTIAQLVERFYDPMEGEILYDNLNVKDIKLKVLRESIGYVSQEPVLILGTIRDNLLFGNKDASQEDIDKALRLANATFVYEMDKKLETYIGSGSVLNLSGGQKQRIAIARALIKNPKMLILDEATSALDPQSEREVQAAIDNISKGDQQLTIIMIAHRLQTIETAQNLLYIESNECLLPGTKGAPEYEEIMNKLKEENYKHQAVEEKIEEEKEVEEDGLPTNLKQIDISRKSSVAQSRADIIHDKKEANTKLQKQKQTNVGMGRIMSFYTPQFLAYFVLIVAIINAFVYPVYGFLFAKILFVMLVPQMPDYLYERNFWCGMFLILAFATMVIGSLEKYIFTIVGENLTFSVRKLLWQQIMYKHVSWFDSKDKAPGILSNVLSEDITKLNGLTTQTISILLEAVLSMVIGAIISFIFSWKISLVSLAISPFVFLGGVCMSRLQWKPQKMQAVNEECDDNYKISNALLSDIIMNYRTVVSFGEKNVDYLMSRYEMLLAEPKQKGIKNAHIAGFLFGYSQFVRYGFIACVFYIASVFIKNKADKPEDTYIAVYVLFVAALGSGISMSNAPSMSVARASANTIFAIIDEKSQIDIREGKGLKQIEKGEIEFCDVDFTYPSRQSKVLRNFDMKIAATKKIALVGHSGCGKSTIANLLLRFYDVGSGSLKIDGKDIREYDVAELRKQIGIVMQEPLLFNISIKDNILYGNPDASDERVREVAKMANALQFIESNIEDLGKEEVKQKIAQDLKQKFQNIVNKFSNFSSLEAIRETMNSEQQLLLLEILQNIDDEILGQINQRMDYFILTLNDHSKDRGIRWDDMVFLFLWCFEIDKIKEYLNSPKNYLNQSQKDQILRAITKFIWKFDLKTVKEWTKENENIENLDDKDLKGFERYIKNEHDRMSKFKSQKLTVLQKCHSKVGDQNGFKLHEGFNKMCGLRGSLLSGGQKQRIAIARALIKDPKILILDEATSALDEQSQEIVQQALDRAMENRTSVVIAHRLSTIRNCEWLFVIHKGKVVEQGAYEELSANKDSYFFKLKSGMEM